jgi:hypothetical protein
MLMLMLLILMLMLMLASRPLHPSGLEELLEGTLPAIADEGHAGAVRGLLAAKRRVDARPPPESYKPPPPPPPPPKKKVGRAAGRGSDGGWSRPLQRP